MKKTSERTFTPPNPERYVPGKFYYFSGDVWECDANRVLYRRRDCGPEGTGDFKNKFFKG